MQPLRVAVVGPGRAGRARIRAIEAHPECALAGVVAREPGPGRATLEEVLGDAAVDALVICTPNLLHAPAARAALEAGKHVAVEFPLASGRGEAAALLELARARGRVLHVEHIELLSASQVAQSERARALGPPQGGALRFAASDLGWIGHDALAGSPALRALARLHRLVDLFGEARVTGASLERGAGYVLRVRLAFEAGGEVELEERRGPGIARSTRWAIRCARGPLDDPPPSSERDLFARDLDVFARRIREGAAPYVSDARVLHVLGLVDAIDAHLLA